MIEVGDFAECVSASHRGERGTVVGFSAKGVSARVDVIGNGKSDFTVRVGSLRRVHQGKKKKQNLRVPAQATFRRETVLWAVAKKLQDCDEWMSKDEWQRELAEALEDGLLL